MFRNLGITACTVALLSLCPASLAWGDCVVVSTPDIAAALQQSDLVFSGVLVNVDRDDRLAFRVDRVWKGQADHEIWIHQVDKPSIGNYVFRPDPHTKYIIFAHRLSDEAQEFRKAPDGFGIYSSCGPPQWSRQTERELNKMTGGSRKPRL